MATAISQVFVIKKKGFSDSSEFWGTSFLKWSPFSRPQWLSIFVPCHVSQGDVELFSICYCSLQHNCVNTTWVLWILDPALSELGFSQVRLIWPLLSQGLCLALPSETLNRAFGPCACSSSLVNIYVLREMRTYTRKNSLRIFFVVPNHLFCDVLKYCTIILSVATMAKLFYRA